MKNKLAVIVTVLAIMVSAVGCGSSDELIKVIIPDETAAQISETELEEQCGIEYENYYEDEDGTLIVEMTSAQHESYTQTLKEGYRDTIDSSNETFQQYGATIDINDAFDTITINAPFDLEESDIESLAQDYFKMLSVFEEHLQSGAEEGTVIINHGENLELQYEFTDKFDFN